MPKRGLVISGGGVKGAFGVGALQHLMGDLGIHYDFVVGTSTGALITPYVATGDYLAVKNLYSNVDSSDILGNVDWVGAVSNGFLSNADPLWKLIQKNVTAEFWGRVQSSPTQMCAVTVDFQTGNTVYFHTGDSLTVPPPTEARKIQSLDELQRAILSSGCEPCFMPTVHIPGATGTHQFVDGGVRDYAPILLALLNGVEELTIIILSPAGYHDTTKEYKDLLSVLLRTIELLTDAVGTQNIGIADQSIQSVLFQQALRDNLVHQQGLRPETVDQILTSVGGRDNPYSGIRLNTPPVVIRPLVPLTFDSLSFSREQMRQMIQTGYDRAREVVAYA